MTMNLRRKILKLNNLTGFKEILKQERELIEAIIKKEFEKGIGITYHPLFEAMEYSLFSGGKRVRPILLKWCAEIGNPDIGILDKAVAAIEYVHTYSLIHDDLPAMDDDDTRRGAPTSHIKYGEGMAILAGDALLTEAFNLLGRTNMINLVLELANNAGAAGMVGGQAADINNDPDSALVNELKTAKLFKASAVMGGIVGKLDDTILASLAEYGNSLGIAFQIRDDLLDNSTSNIGPEKNRAKKLIDKAKFSVKNLMNSDKLVDLADFVIARKY